MTAPSPALHARLRPVIGAQWINFGLCVSLLSVAFALRHGIPPAVWIRSTIILVVSLFMLLCGQQMRRGRRWAYVRAKWIAALGTIGFVGVAALPGPFPAWMQHRAERPSTSVLGAHLDADAARACVALSARRSPDPYGQAHYPFRCERSRCKLRLSARLYCPPGAAASFGAGLCDHVACANEDVHDSACADH